MRPPHAPSRTASSQVSWALLTEGVAAARVDLHRVKLLVERAARLVEDSEAREHLYQVAGDLITGLPQRIADAEVSLDRTSYALALMGEDFLRGRLPLGARNRVDEAEATAPYSKDRRVKESDRASAARVAARWAEARRASDEHFFHDNPQKRSVREFADTEAVANDPGTAAAAAREAESPIQGPGAARADAKAAPPTPDRSVKKPGGREFGTLNQFLVHTEQKVRGTVPESRDELPRHPKLGGGR